MHLVYRPRAATDIAEIWDYIAEDSLVQADAWVDRLDDTLNLLATQPKIGRARPDILIGIRSHPFGRYVVFYMPMDEGIDVVRVLHSARNAEGLFDNP